MIFAKENIRRLTDDPLTAASLARDGFVRIDAAEEAAAKAEEKAEEKTDAPVDISEMSVTALRALAKEKGIKGASGLTKADLMEILKES